MEHRYLYEGRTIWGHGEGDGMWMSFSQGSAQRQRCPAPVSTQEREPIFLLVRLTTIRRRKSETYLPQRGCRSRPH